MVLIYMAFHFVTLSFGAQAQYANLALMPDINYLKAPKSNEFEKNQRAFMAFTPPQELDADDFIPTNIPNDASGRHVASRIAQHSAQTLLNSRRFRRSEVGRGAAAMDRKMATDIHALPGSKPLEFRVQAAQTMASIRYAGFGQTVVSYRLYDQAVLVEMSGQVAGKIRIVADHLDSPDEKAGKLSLRWTW